MAKLFKSRHLPYRLLTKLIYNGPESVLNSQIEPPSDFIIKRYLNLGEASKSLRCSNARVLEALDWLSALGFLTYIKTDKHVNISITLPIK